jgi:hypothetical protein
MTTLDRLFKKGLLNRKRLTNTSVRGRGFVLKFSDGRRTNGFSTQTTYTRRSSGVGGRIHEQQYAPQRVMSESGFELQHTGSPSEETALEEKAYASFFGRAVGEGGVGRQAIADAARRDFWAASSAARWASDRGTS